ncbi:hypothetical protein Q5425_44050 [Amycolatopsis sp. A133]|uniref:hypothetical protein n=1 Tax=Amycolatopsis sp. A133 TaxID=3064472 RepID=UPI0027E928F7|nr:hypothetical protein [Amycolatopsis sp. A133]MDQ7810740.1 hypothetical protein [Amycolatopsis sp. A133]
MLVTVVAVLLGGALLGIIRALVVIPVAAAILRLAEEVPYARLDQSVTPTTRDQQRLRCSAIRSA